MFYLPLACQSETRYNIKKARVYSKKGNYFLTLAVKFSSNIILLEVIETWHTGGSLKRNKYSCLQNQHMDKNQITMPEKRLLIFQPNMKKIVFHQAIIVGTTMFFANTFVFLLTLLIIAVFLSCLIAVHLYFVFFTLSLLQGFRLKHQRRV